MKILLVAIVLSISCVLLSALPCAHAEPRTWSDDGIVEMALVLRGRAVPSGRLEKLAGQSTLGTRCGTPLAMLLGQALGSRDVSPAVLAKVQEIMAIQGEDSEYETANFALKYTIEPDVTDRVKDHLKDTASNVTLSDGSVIGLTIAKNGVPDYVERLAIVLEYSLQKYRQLGFQDPYGIKGRVVVEVKHLGAQGQALPNLSEWWFSTDIEIKNTLSDKDLVVVAAHELFHRIQISYYNSPLDPYNGVVGDWRYEGTATWAEDLVDDSNNSYSGFIGHLDPFYPQPYYFFSNPNRSLLGLKYETVLFWKYLSEQYTAHPGEPHVGYDVVRTFWEEERYADGIDCIDVALARLGHTRRFEDVFIGWTVANYAKDLHEGRPPGPRVDDKYDYREHKEANYGSVIPTVPDRTLTDASPAYSHTHNVNAWASNYFVFNLGSSVRQVQIDIRPETAESELAYSILEIRNSQIVQIRTSRYTESVSTRSPRSAPLDRIAVIVAGLQKGGEYTLSVEPIQPEPILQVRGESTVDERSWTEYKFILWDESDVKHTLGPDDVTGTVSPSAPATLSNGTEGLILTTQGVDITQAIKITFKHTYQGKTLTNTISVNIVNTDKATQLPTPLPPDGTDPVVETDPVLSHVVVAETIRPVEAKNSITAGPNYTITSIGGVEFRAGKVIKLVPGFKAERSCSFRALIVPSLAGKPAPSKRSVPSDGHENADRTNEP